MPAGRPRTFDRDQALHRAMLVFWEKGYEGTTMSDLVNTIGVKGPGVYAAFGNKDDIFNEVVKHYEGIVRAGPMKVLSETPAIYDAVKSFLDFNVKTFTNPDNPASCLIVTAAINCAPDNQAHVDTLKEVRKTYKKALQTRFQQAVKDKQLIEATSAADLAEFYTALINGLALRSRDGASKKELQTTCRFGLQTLQSMIATPA